MTSLNFEQFLALPPPPIVTRFITKAFVLSSQNPWYPLPPKALTSFMGDPYYDFAFHYLLKSEEDESCNRNHYGPKKWYEVFLL